MENDPNKTIDGILFLKFAKYFTIGLTLLSFYECLTSKNESSQIIFALATIASIIALERLGSHINDIEDEI